MLGPLGACGKNDAKQVRVDGLFVFGSDMLCYGNEEKKIEEERVYTKLKVSQIVEGEPDSLSGVHNREADKEMAVPEGEGRHSHLERTCQPCDRGQRLFRLSHFTVIISARASSTTPPFTSLDRQTHPICR